VETSDNADIASLTGNKWTGFSGWTII